MHILTVYYSRKGENYYNKEIRFLEKGNTEIAAEMVVKAVGGDLFEIDTVKPYAANFRECCREAKAELDADVRPPLKAFLPDISQYDVIFVCYPNWCDTVPMCILTFLDHYELAEKKLFPLCTNEGSGAGRSVAHLRQLYPLAEIEDGLAVMGCRVMGSEEEIVGWAKAALNLAKKTSNHDF